MQFYNTTRGIYHKSVSLECSKCKETLITPRNTQAMKQAKVTKAVTLVEKEDEVKEKVTIHLEKGNHPPRAYGGSWKPKRQSTNLSTLSPVSSAS